MRSFADLASSGWLRAGFALGLSCIVASAVEIAEVTFADQVVAGGKPLQVYGGGTLTYRLFFTAYAAVLYLPADAAIATALDDVPKRLEFHYFYAIAATDFVDATKRTIGDNLDAATMARIQPAVAQLNALYRDVKPGDRYALSYLPGVGTELALDAKPLGVVPGAEFARALFAIWLGAKPLDAAFKTALITKLTIPRRAPGAGAGTHPPAP